MIHTGGTSDGPRNTKSLVRGLDILACFGFDRRELGLTELTKISGLNKATVYRLASTLVSCHFLRYDESKRYSLGSKIFELGRVAHASFSLRKIADPHIKSFNVKVDGARFLGILQDDELLYLNKEDNNPIFRFSSEVGTRRPPHFGVIGQLLMAYLPESEVDRLLEKSPLQPLTKKSITSPEGFKEKLRMIRQEGFGIEEGEVYRAISGIAAPVRDFTGKVVAALGVTFISTPVDHHTVRQTIADTVRTAADISRDMAYVKKAV
jgi:DNA-binding IclR family transcriptional regulator